MLFRVIAGVVGDGQVLAVQLYGEGFGGNVVLVAQIPERVGIAGGEGGIGFGAGIVEDLVQPGEGLQGVVVAGVGLEPGEVEVDILHSVVAEQGVVQKGADGKRGVPVGHAVADIPVGRHAAHVAGLSLGILQIGDVGAAQQVGDGGGHLGLHGHQLAVLGLEEVVPALAVRNGVVGGVVPGPLVPEAVLLLRGTHQVVLVHHGRIGGTHVAEGGGDFQLSLVGHPQQVVGVVVNGGLVIVEPVVAVHGVLGRAAHIGGAVAELRVGLGDAGVQQGVHGVGKGAAHAAAGPGLRTVVKGGGLKLGFQGFAVFILQVQAVDVAGKLFAQLGGGGHDRVIFGVFLIVGLQGDLGLSHALALDDNGVVSAGGSVIFHPCAADVVPLGGNHTAALFHHGHDGGGDVAVECMALRIPDIAAAPRGHFGAIVGAVAGVHGVVEHRAVDGGVGVELGAGGVIGPLIGLVGHGEVGDGAVGDGTEELVAHVGVGGVCAVLIRDAGGADLIEGGEVVGAVPAGGQDRGEGPAAAGAGDKHELRVALTGQQTARNVVVVADKADGGLGVGHSGGGVAQIFAVGLAVVAAAGAVGDDYHAALQSQGEDAAAVGG